MIRTPDARDHLAGIDQISALALEAWLARVVNPHARLTSEHVEASRRKKLEIADHIPQQISVDLMSNANLARFRNGLSASTGASGGFTAPESPFVAAWEQALLALPMRQLATTIRPEGNVYREPTTDDTSNEGFILNEKNTASAVDVTWQQVVHTPYKFHSSRILVPEELHEDATNFAPQLATLLGSRVARLQNRKFSVGTGTGEPTGVVTGCRLAGSTYTAANATSIVADDILNLIATVGAGYIDPAACTFQMHRATWLAIAKLKNGQGGYLFDPSTFKLAGFPVYLNHHLDSVLASNAVSVVFGQVSKYHICDFGGARLIRDSESHADADEVSWGAILRSSGQLIDAGTHPVAALIH